MTKNVFVPSGKGSALNEKNLHKLRANSFLLEKNPFQKGFASRKHAYIILTPLNPTFI